ncbi:hypothetical protein Agub_g1831, partial [Astrephomene gubernaculifera]
MSRRSSSSRAGASDAQRRASGPSGLVDALARFGNSINGRGGPSKAALDKASDIGSRLTSALDDKEEDEASIAIPAMTQPTIRSGLMKVLVLAVRNLSERRPASKRESQKWKYPFMAVLRLAKATLDARQGSSPVPHPLESEIVRLMIKTDHLSCLSRLLDKITTEIAVPPAAGQAATTSAAVRRTPIRMSEGFVIGDTAHLVKSLLCLVRSRASGHYARLGLMDALARSNLFEHLPRTVMLQLWKFAGRPGDEDTRIILLPTVWALCAMLEVLTMCRGMADPRVARWATRILSGPCLQHFCLVLAVTQLCAADGGSAFGLPPGAQLPPVICNPNTGELVVPVLWTGPRSPALHAEPLVHIVDFWLTCTVSGGALRPPCSDAALQALCVRLADAANASIEEGSRQQTGGTRDQQRAAAAAAPRPQFYRPLCMQLACRALMCAVSSAMQGDGGMARLWVPIIRTVHNALSEGMERQEELGAEQLQELLRPRLPLLRPGQCPLPTEVHPSIAVPLAAGYVPCLERLQRRALHANTKSIKTAAAAAAALFEHFGDFGRLSCLLAYGEMRSVAALIATGAKLLTCAAAGFDAAVETREQQGASLASVMELLNKFSTADVNIVAGLHVFDMALGNNPESQRYVDWWKRGRDAAGAAAAAGAVSGGSGGGGREASGTVGGVQAGGVSTGGSRGGGSGTGGSRAGGGSAGEVSAAGGSSSSSGTAAGFVRPSEPTTRLLTLTTFTLMRWVPAVARAAIACHGMAPSHCAPGPDSEAVTRNGTSAAVALTALVFSWVPSIAQAYVSSISSDAPAAADSWRKLLLQEVDIFGLIRSQLLYLRSCWERYGSTGGTTQRVDLLVAVLTPLALAFPEETQAALSVPLVSEPRLRLAGVPANEVLDVLMGRRVARSPLEIVHAVCEGVRPSMEE